MKKKIVSAIIVVLIIGLITLKLTISKQTIKQSKAPNTAIMVESKLMQETGAIITPNSVYQYIDTHGNLVITNKPKPQAKKIDLPPLIVYANPMTANDLYANGYTEPQNIGGGDNKKYKPIININETSRQLVLNEELAHERQALTNALTLLNEAKRTKLSTESDKEYLIRLQSLQDNLEEHKKNIQMLVHTISSYSEFN